MIDKNEGYKSRKSCVYKLHYHVVFCVKYRKNVLKDKMRSTIQRSLYETGKSMRFTIDEWNIGSDHFHCIVSNSIDHPIMEVVGRLKGRLSHDLRKNFPELKTIIPRYLWSRGKFVATTGGVTLEHVKKYIENQ